MSLSIEKIDTSKHAIKQRKLMELGVIPNHPGITVFSAGQGGGKSTLVANLLKKENMYGESYEGMEDLIEKQKGKKRQPKKEGYFDAIFCFLGSDDDMYDHLIDSGIIKQNHVCHMPTADDIQKVIDGQRMMIDKAGGDMTQVPKILCLFDDVVNDSRLMRSKPFLELFVKGRHINSSTWFLTQYFNLVPKACRLQANWTFVGRCNRAETQVLCDQYCPESMTKKEFATMIHEATVDDEKSKNNFFIIVKRAPEDQRFRKNLDQFINLKRHKRKPKLPQVKKPTKKELANRDFDNEKTVRELQNKPEKKIMTKGLASLGSVAEMLKRGDERPRMDSGVDLAPAKPKKKKLVIRGPNLKY